jgi:hypothetical protein
MTHLLAAAAEAGSAGAEFAPYIAGAITAAVFIFAAVVLRSFRDVAHRSTTGGDAHGSDHA